MKSCVSIQSGIFALCLCAALAACGSTGGGNSNTTPPPSVTSVTVSPATTSVFAGATQQFTASVVGSAGVSTAVTWSVVGDGTISDSGLFTAGSSSGAATVMATSQVDSVTGSAAVTVSYQPVAFGNWYGTLVSSDETQTLPMDFSLTRTGNSLGTTNNKTVLVISTDPTVPFPPCENFDLQYAGNAQIAGELPTPSNLTGIISGQNVSMSYTPASTTVSYPISLTGTLSQDGSTISGTFSKTAYGCFANVTTGTFSFTQYPSLSATYSGAVTSGTLQVPFSISGGGADITVGAIATTGCPASSYSMIGEQEGRFFHLWEADVAQGSTPLVVWGIENDPAGATLNTFVMAQLTGYGGTVNQCFEPLSPLEATLTAAGNASGSLSTQPTLTAGTYFACSFVGPCSAAQTFNSIPAAIAANITGTAFPVSDSGTTFTFTMGNAVQGSSSAAINVWVFSNNSTTQITNACYVGVGASTVSCGISGLAQGGQYIVVFENTGGGGISSFEPGLITWSAQTTAQ